MLDKGHKFGQRFFMSGVQRHLGIVGGVADDQVDIGAFVFRATQNLGQKVHGAGGVGQTGQTGVVQRGNQKAGGNTDRLLHIVVFDTITVFIQTISLGKNHDKTTGPVEKGIYVFPAEAARRYHDS